MSERRIVQMGHPVLRQVAASVADPTAPALRALAADMVRMMDEAGGVGLAAPQLGLAQRLIVYAVPRARLGEEDGEGPLPPRAIVNPVLQPLEERMETGWEGCLSIAGLRGLVPRHAVLRLTGTDTEGRAIDLVARGFHARVLQHEVDHLDGVLYLDRMSDLSSLAFDAELERLAAERAAAAAETSGR